MQPRHVVYHYRTASSLVLLDVFDQLCSCLWAHPRRRHHVPTDKQAKLLYTLRRRVVKLDTSMSSTVCRSNVLLACLSMSIAICTCICVFVLLSLSAENEQLRCATECRICWQNQVDRVLKSCGHLLCSECLARLQDDRCHICRTPIGEVCVVKLPTTRNVGQCPT